MGGSLVVGCLIDGMQGCLLDFWCVLTVKKKKLKKTKKILVPKWYSGVIKNEQNKVEEKKWNKNNQEINRKQNDNKYIQVKQN